MDIRSASRAARAVTVKREGFGTLGRLLVAALVAGFSLAAQAQNPEPPVLSFQMMQKIPLVTLHGLPGDTNQIETANSLDAPVWVPLATVVLTNAAQEWYDRISPPGARRFYRSVLLGSGSWPTPGPSFVWVPAGTFVMGSPSSEAERYSRETQHTVTLTKGFYMGKYEVTQGEYTAVMGSNPSHFVPANGHSGNVNRPVEQVSWYDAVAYCDALTQRELTAGKLPSGWTYRLPTEAEWEYACRAGTTTAFHYGNALRSGMANFGGYYEYDASVGTIENSSGIDLGETTVVGSYAPNGWGLYDMHANVWEWCQDWYVVYPSGSVTDPKGASSGSERVLRGGSWYSFGGGCRSAFRSSSYPDDRSLYLDIGFRLVLAPGQP